MKIFELILSGIVAVSIATMGTADLPAPAEGAPSPMPYAAGNGALTLALALDRGDYTLDTVIGSTVTVTNNTDRTMVFVKGSGSNTVPDALKYTIGGFVPLFKPEMTTMDFQMDDLAPGESVTYRCDFAPYIPKDGLPGFGAGRDIEYFKTGDFNPAPLGTAEGSLSFTYFLQEAGTSTLMMFDTSGLEEKSVSIDDIAVTIV